MIIALIVFVVSSFLGIHVFTYLINGRETPKVSVILHSALSASAITMVFVGVRQGGIFLQLSLYFFLAAAAAGIFMVYKDVFKGKIPPRFLIIVHPVLAVTGLVLLIISVFAE